MTITMAPCQEITRIRSMADLRAIFKTPEDVNEMNAVLFSTSGIHGHYLTIEQVEEALINQPEDEDEREQTLTVLVLHPRCVTMRFGNIPVTLADIPYLKELRSRSWDALQTIGKSYA